MKCLAFLLLLSGCVLQPTKVSETQRREFDLLVDKSARPLEIADNTVVLDARSSFDYGLNRVANSIHFPWDSLAETTASGEVIRDSRKAGLKLALNGLRPETPVVVLGYAGGGQGEEGRLAWTLLYLGFQDVQVSVAETFRKTFTQNPTAPVKNTDPWPVSPRAEMQVSRDEFRKLMADPKGRLNTRAWIIDVRSDKEYFDKSTPDIHSLHMFWKEFYTVQGRPNPAVRTKLASLGIQSNDRVILVSNKGVRSGAAAYALLALGFSKVQNFTGGWKSLSPSAL